jgi:signal transduction histidine kinase
MMAWCSPRVTSERHMNKSVIRLTRPYTVALKKYLADEQEAVLAQAYELGRLAIARGLGVLDMARMHQQALENSGFPTPNFDRNSAQKAAGTFFLESLSPFEVTHRGFRETNSRLEQLIATLEKRNLQLAETNQELEVEIGERKRTEKALRESEENLRNLSNQILYVQEEERKRISRELHDEVGQALTAISMNLESLKKNGIMNSPSLVRKLADTQNLLQATMETAHRFARELRPAMLDELGLLPALRSYLKAFASRTGLRVHFRGNPVAENLAGDQKTVLFRVAQESLTNVGKHARARQVKVTLRPVLDGICMEIADNGRSFKANATPSAGNKKRLGLLGMQERVRLVNGRFTIHLRPGRGTTIRVVIPCKPSNAPLRANPVRSHRGDGQPVRLAPTPPRIQ